ncbi:MAG TPA: protein kinase, partial [Acidobacteriota bacterium]|nr:protein kinase [Acidobacteriota bacterium]
MTPERWLKAKELFCQALECEPGRRNAFLEHACASDQELLLEVESLLSAVEDSQPFFHQPAVDLLGLNGLKLGEFLEEDELSPDSGPADPDLPLPEIPKSKSALIGQQIGNYRLTQLIGRGGMGAVFLAVRADDDYEHEVAVKIVARPVLTREVLRRFRTERQILARLDHPNIAKLFDGGTTPDGLPYFVMEYIEGEPIGSYCDNRQLSIPERLRLFLKVCEAVQYAHQNLVIHRDIKPGNILVTADGIPKLLDFGIAKVLTPRTSAVQTLETTQFGVLALTPRYASPEQVRGQTVTTVSDVYSLGVLLYELLTGVPPYEFSQMVPAEIERVVCLVEPPRPGDVVRDRKKARVEASVEVEVGQSLPSAKTALERSTARGTTPEKLRLQLLGDLDTIVLTALQKEPERRYPLVAKLAEDIERYLTGLPVLARGDTIRYRFGKYVRRHKLAVAATVLVVVSLLGGTGVSLWQAHRANQERIKAEQAQAKSDRRFNDVRHLANKFLFDFHDKIENLPGSTEARKMIVEESLKYLDSLSKEAADDPELQMELAIAYRKVGDVQGRPYSANLGSTEGAQESYQNAIGMLETLSANNPATHLFQFELAQTYERLGKLQELRIGNNLLADQYYAKAQKYLERLMSANPNNYEYQKQLVAVLNTRGVVLEEADLPSDALEVYYKALALQQKLVLKDPLDQPSKRRLAVVYQSIGLCLQSLGDFLAPKISDQKASQSLYLQALEVNERALAILEKITENNPSHSIAVCDVASMCQTIALLLIKMDTSSVYRAKALEKRALMVFENLIKQDPKSIEYKIFLAAHLNLRGDIARLCKNYRQANNAYFQVIQICKDLTKENIQNQYLQYLQALSLFNLGVVKLLTHQPKVSLKLLFQALLLSDKLAKTNQS